MNPEDRFSELLMENLAPGPTLPSGGVSRLYAHFELLCRWNQVLSLTTVESLEEAVVRHYAEALFLGRLLPCDGKSVLDLGSGGGFPGLPMAVQCPANVYVLAESHQRKAVFLREASRDLGNVRVFSGRAELFREPVDWVVSRAVKPVEVVKCAHAFRASVGLLLGEEDVARVRATEGYNWHEAVRLPWGRKRFALIGDVPRGTSR